MKDKPILFSGEMVRAIQDGKKTQTSRVIKPQPWRDPAIQKEMQPNAWVWSSVKAAEGLAYDEMAKRRCFRMAWSEQPLSPREAHPLIAYSPYSVGDHLWVRETWRVNGFYETGHVEVIYRSDNDRMVLSVPDEAEDWHTREWIRYSDAAILAGVPTDDDGCFDLANTDWRSPWKSSRFMPKWAARIWLEVTDLRAKRIQDISYDEIIAEGWDVEANLPVAAWEDARAWFIALWDKLNQKRGYGWDMNSWCWVIAFKQIQP